MLFPFFRAVRVIFGGGWIELPTVPVAALSFFTRLQLLAVRLSHADGLSDRIQVIAARRGRAAADRLVASGFSILPTGIDIAARKRRICALIVLEPIGELLGAGRDVSKGGLDFVVDPVFVQIISLVVVHGYPIACGSGDTYLHACRSSVVATGALS